MDNEMKKKSKYLPGVLSFAIPVIIMAMSFAGIGIYPGGKNTVLTYDLKAQFLSLYGYISNPGPGFDNLFYSMSGGLGGNFYGVALLCLSPLDIIYKFVPLKYLPEAVYFMILFKVGLCGLSCNLFLAKCKKIDIPDLSGVLLSCCYALMSYNFMYFMAPMWYDEVILLPVLALLLEDVIEGKKSIPFILVCALAIICDYYIAFMVVIALVLYFVFRLSEEKYSFRISCRRILLLAGHGFFAAGISLFVLIPAVMDLRTGKISESLITGGEMIKNTPADVLKSLFPQDYAGLGYNASPSVFCGTVVTLLAIIWLFNVRKPIKELVTGLVIFGFYIASFIFGPLDRMWHGFREPMNFSVRYAFTFSFFFIVFSARSIAALRKKKISISAGLQKGLFAGAFIYTLFELYLNGSFVLAKIGTESGYAIRSEYGKFTDMAEKIIPYSEMQTPGGYGRMIQTDSFSSYDGALFGYDGIARFCSSYNFRVSEFFRDLGMGSIYQSLKNKGITPPVASLLNVRYYLSFIEDYSGFYTSAEEYNGYTLYENEQALPLAYEIAESIGSSNEFVENPFYNINLTYSDLLGADQPIFTEADYETLALDTDLEDTVRSNKQIGFNADKSGHYYLFVSYMSDEYDDPDEEAVAFKRSLYLDGNYFGDYAVPQYSYCIDLGDLPENSYHTVILESSAFEVGEVWLYYYNEDALKAVSSSVNGFEIEEIGRNGLRFIGNTEEDSQIMISLPYEDGYSIYVDRVKTDYSSYRDTLVTVPVSKGSHEITVKYFPPGLKWGVVFSLISTILCSLWIYAGLKRIKTNPDKAVLL